MKKLSFSSLLILSVLLMLASCGIHRSKAVFDRSFDEIENSILVQNHNPYFPMPEIPQSISNGKDRAVFLSKHYWEEFPFDDVSLIDQPKVTEQAFVDYIHVLNFIPFRDARRSIKYLFVLAQKDKAMYGHFASLFEKYFYTADSPFCNEELYIPVLETILKSDMLTEEDHEKLHFHD